MNLDTLCFGIYVVSISYLLVGLVCASAMTVFFWDEIWDPTTLWNDSRELDVPLRVIRACNWLTVITGFLGVTFGWAYYLAKGLTQKEPAVEDLP